MCTLPSVFFACCYYWSLCSLFPWNSTLTTRQYLDLRRFAIWLNHSLTSNSPWFLACSRKYFFFFFFFSQKTSSFVTLSGIATSLGWTPERAQAALVRWGAIGCFCFVCFLFCFGVCFVLVCWFCFILFYFVFILYSFGVCLFVCLFVCFCFLFFVCLFLFVIHLFQFHLLEQDSMVKDGIAWLDTQDKEPQYWFPGLLNIQQASWAIPNVNKRFSKMRLCFTVSTTDRQTRERGEKEERDRERQRDRETEI